ncbi:MAG: hypothetical protein H0X30_06970 [Anaerolineae bacterium]|nr:hypothetical protein [Anaerolineae bacterium]
MDNLLVQVRGWFGPLVRWTLLSATRWQGGSPDHRQYQNRLWLSFGVSVAYRRRSVSIAWIWAVGTRGHSTSFVQMALLRYIRKLLPLIVRVSLFGDTEFERPLLIVHIYRTGVAIAH